VKNKFATTIFFVLITVVSMCGISNLSYAQATELNQQPLEIKSAFFGRWTDAKDPNHLLEIYKEGTLIIVQRRSEVNDHSGSSKYTVMYSEGNKIKVDLQTGLAPLTITDDGTKISFLGNEYIKK